MSSPSHLRHRREHSPHAHRRAAAAVPVRRRRGLAMRASAFAAGTVVVGAAALLSGTSVLAVPCAAPCGHVPRDVTLVAGTATDDFLKDLLDSWGIGDKSVPDLLDQWTPTLTIGQVLSLLDPSVSTETTLGQLLTGWHLTDPIVEYLSLLGWSPDETLASMLGVNGISVDVLLALVGVPADATVQQVLGLGMGSPLDQFAETLLTSWGLSGDSTFAEAASTLLNDSLSQLFADVALTSLLGDIGTKTVGDLLGFDVTDATLLSSYLTDLGVTQTIDELLGLTDTAGAGAAAAADAATALFG